MGTSLKLAGLRPGSGIIKNIREIFSPNYRVGEALTKKSPFEISVGDTVCINKREYRVMKAPRAANCSGCAFLSEGICQKTSSHYCSAYSRMDKTWVIFTLENKK